MSLNIKLSVILIIGKGKVFHFKSVINDLIIISRYKSDIIFRIGSKMLFNLSD